MTRTLHTDPVSGRELANEMDLNFMMGAVGSDCSAMGNQIQLSAEDLARLSPSPLIKQLGAQIVADAKGKPILDVACGGGRNAVLLAHLGGNVIGIDNDLKRLEAERVRLADTIFAPAFSKIKPFSLDLLADEWPFQPGSIGGIVNVHFLCSALFPAFASSIVPGGCLLLETIQGRGGNYLQLPKAKTLQSAFENFFALNLYKERKAGPKNHDAVTVQMFGTRL